jgi:predicted NAD/FAD-binding protein
MRIAIVGTGISGMVAAYLLHAEHKLVVYEANDYIGGHTNTVEIEAHGRRYAIDTGFIVYNELNYPNFSALIGQLGIESQPAPMSFSVRCEQTGLEYSPTTLNALFAQRRNLLNPRFWRMVADIFRFRKESAELLRPEAPNVTLRDYLHGKHYSRAFMEHFLIPMGAAIWSADPISFQEFPARFFCRFFHRQGFLNVRNQPQWRTICTGAQRYVEALTRPYRGAVRLGTPVTAIRRYPDRVEVTAANVPPEKFDQVILATHSDQALRLLVDATRDERRVLGAIPYQENETVLHTDETLLPRFRLARAAWNYHVPEDSRTGATVTYSMNRLQRLEAPEEFCVTLNATETIASAKILRRTIYHHPVYTPAALDAQMEFDIINGTNRTYFCGAYWGYGFHEDGVNSAIDVGRYFGKSL